MAGSLLAARAEGARRSILVTGDDNAPARTAYRALGYAPVGGYALVVFEDPG